MISTDLTILNNIDHFTASAYGEPGHIDPTTGIIFANWNNVPSEIQDTLEEQGYELEWSDEWIICDEGLAWRTSPDSYSWSPSYRITDHGDILTLRSDIQEWIEETHCYDHMQTPQAIPSNYDLTSEGFIKFNSDGYESGWFPGQTDDPKDILAKILEAYPNAKVCFQASSSQFYASFDAYYLPESSNY